MMKLINREISDQVNSTKDGYNSLSYRVQPIRLPISAPRLLDTPNNVAWLGYFSIDLAKPKIVVGRRK